MDDRELLRLIAGGDEGALEEFVSRYEHRLKGFLRVYLNNAADVDEALSETMVAVWTSAERYQGKAQPCFWVMGIARNMAFRQHRRPRHRESQELDPSAPDPSLGPDSETWKREVRHAVRSLTTRLREVVVLTYWLGYTSREIAEILGIPAKTVRTRLYNARKKMKETLDL